MPFPLVLYPASYSRPYLSVELLEKEATLKSNPNLRVLEFGSPAAYSALYGADDLSFEWFPTMLGNVSSKMIETVGFFLWDAGWGAAGYWEPRIGFGRIV